MTRSILAVILGYAVFSVASVLLFRLSGQDPRVFPDLPFLLFSVLYGMVFAALGGFTASAIATSREVHHAVAVAVLIGAVALLSAAVQWGRASLWSQVSVLLFMVPSSVAGGLIQVRVRRRPWAH